MRLFAGNTDDIRSDSGRWIILDIGFSQNRKSCGLIIGSREPVCCTYVCARRQIVDCCAASDKIVNLVIEAPLSVCFDSKGNPRGRSVEKTGKKTRYWYCGAGASVMVASMYLLKELSEHESNATVKLFEGMVSFKSREIQSDHILDVRLLRDAVQNPGRFPDSVVAPDNLRQHPSDKLVSAFLVMGLKELGIPPVIRCESDRP